MNKRILFKEDARTKVAEGINIVAEAVKVTLGAGGRTVIISDGERPTRTTKDGVTVAGSIYLKDHVVNAGAKMAKEISSKTADVVGDGTTSVIILFNEIVKNGLALIQSGVNPMLLKRGMDAAVKSVVKKLDEIKFDVGDDTKLLKQIAAVSANNDKEIGDIVGSVFEKLGKYGIVSVEDSMTEETTIEIIDGFQFISGWAIDHFINVPVKNTVELKNPYVLIIEDKLDRKESIRGIMNKVAAEKRSLVVIADDFSYDVYGILLENINVLPSCAIKYNFMGETKNELMKDLCAMTGATLVTEKTGKKMETMDLSSLGEAEKITCTKDDTTIVKGRSTKADVDARIEDAKTKIENAKNPFHKQLQERRVAKFTGGVAICKVAGATEVELSEKKDRIDDSIRATKAAIEEGVVVGGGTALLRCLKDLSEIDCDTEDEQRGVNLIMNSIEKPAYQICENASGKKTALIIEKVKEESGAMGYNAVSGRIENLYDAGIIDPKKVVRVCIENAASAAAQVLISEALIVNDETN